MIRNDIRNASTTPSNANQQRNVNTLRMESRNITTEPGEIDDRKSEVITLFVNAGMNITAITLIVSPFKQIKTNAL